MAIEVLGWKEHQHYKNRRPVWIKFYVRLLDDPHYRQLSPPARCLLADLWLLASDSLAPCITLTNRQLAWRLRMNEGDVESGLKELASVNAEDGTPQWITLSASNLLATGYQPASAETETETEAETETEFRGAATRPRRAVPIPPTGAPQDWTQQLIAVRKTHHPACTITPGRYLKWAKALIEERGWAEVFHQWQVFHQCGRTFTDAKDEYGNLQVYRRDPKTGNAVDGPLSLLAPERFRQTYGQWT